MKQKSVSEIMTRDVISIDPDLGVETAVQLMGMHEIRRLPVVSKAARLVGIITREEARLALQEQRSAQEQGKSRVTAVREVMVRAVSTIGPLEPIGRAAQVMANHSVGGLPVLDDRELVGIVTESDIFKYVVQQWQADVVADGAAAEPG